MGEAIKVVVRDGGGGAIKAKVETTDETRRFSPSFGVFGPTRSEDV